MSRDKLYKDRYLDEHTKIILSCLEERGEISCSTSKEINSHIRLINYGYILSAKGKDLPSEILMLSIGAFGSALICILAESAFKDIANFNYIIAIIFVVLILIRVLRR